MYRVWNIANLSMDTKKVWLIDRHTDLIFLIIFLFSQVIFSCSRENKVESFNFCNFYDIPELNFRNFSN